MFNLFFEGGWLFMTLVTIPAIMMLFFSGKVASKAFGSSNPLPLQSSQLYYIRFFGVLALVIGVFGQTIGLYEAMKDIAAMGNISQAMLAGGIRVSFITTLYGFFVFVLAHILWFVLDLKLKDKLTHR